MTDVSLGKASLSARPNERDSTTEATNDLTRAVFAILPREALNQRRNWTKAQVSTVEWPRGSGRRVVVKDLRACPLLYRWLHGRRLLKREEKVLRELDSVPFAPRLLARLDADALVTEHREGEVAIKIRKGQMSAQAILNLENGVRALHDTGRTHGDLHPSNVLVNGDEVSVLDWATSHAFGRGKGALQAMMFREWQTLDWRHIAKLKLRHAPELLSDQERDLLTRGGSRLQRWVRNLRFWKARALGQEKPSPRTVRARYRQTLDDLP